MTETTLKRRGPKPGNKRMAPIYPDKVKTIVRMREEQGLTYAAIAKVVGGTRMGACNQYHRWKDWARVQ